MTAPFPRRPMLSATLAGLLFAACGFTPAHDWTSVATHPYPPSPPYAAGSVGWSGMVWPGWSAGAPAAPSASDCRRSPTSLDIAGPEPYRPARHELRDHRERRALPAPHVAARPAERSDSARSEEKSMAPATPTAPPAAAPQPYPSAGAATPAPPRPAHEPVTAGVVDDNADFGEYLAFRRRHGGLRIRDRDIAERYRLVVNDAAGRPVPDAVVSLHAGSSPRPLVARTDAGGQVWLHPRAAGIHDALLEVQVSKPMAEGELRGSALLRRGQRDGLQIRLDGRAPAERARLDLVFLVDATGSMGDEIDKLKRSMHQIADQISRLPSRPDLCFGLVAYRDRGDEFFVRMHDLTNDLDAFQQVLGALRASAGGDYAEALNEALHTAVHRIGWRGDGATRLVVLVADAPPHLDYGQPWYDDDMQAALARGVKVFSIAASGLDRSGEYVFRQMAQYTGGRFVFLTYDRARDPSSGPGRETVHDVGNYSVETLDRLVVRLVSEELARRPS
jgi:Mg-chelatase subunit ChlD